jgi:hypothetical protein
MLTMLPMLALPLTLPLIWVGAWTTTTAMMMIHRSMMMTWTVLLGM